MLFLDWGNREIVEESDLFELPEELQFIEKQCLKAKLHMVRPTKKEDYLERLRGDLMDG